MWAPLWFLEHAWDGGVAVAWDKLPLLFGGRGVGAGLRARTGPPTTSPEPVPADDLRWFAQTGFKGWDFCKRQWKPRLKSGYAVRGEIQLSEAGV